MSAPGRYYLTTFGCRVNQADSGTMARDLEAQDLERSGSHRDADVVVLNTCTVTHRSDADVRKAVRRIQRENPKARVIVTGCMAQRDPEALVQLPGVHAVVGNAHKGEVGDLVGRLADEAPEGPPVVVHTAMTDRAAMPIDPTATVLDRTRPFVKIQDGCDAHCTYCIIPSVRGRARSADPDQVIDAVQGLVRDGYVEVVLAGVHLGTYRLEHQIPDEPFAFDPGGQFPLTGLVRQLLDIDGLKRLRLSCIEPMAFPLELAELAASDPRLAPHFHLPLQSGSDRVLKRMVRPYRCEDYLRIVDIIRSRLPRACIGTDVIVGFPGETNDDFQGSVEVVRTAVDYVHVFSYSARAGTPSTRLDGQIDPRIIKERATTLTGVGRDLWRSFLDGQIGQTLDAVTLGPNVREPGVTNALSDNYCPIRIEGIEGTELPGNLAIRVRATDRREDAVLGRPV